MKTADLATLVGLFERAHTGYVGFAERSVEDFRWRYLDHPDIGMAGVIIVEDEQEQVVGYVVVGISGTVFESAIDPDSNRREVADVLIAEVERHLSRTGIDEIVLHAPLDDQDMAAALRTAGYGRGSPIQQYLSFIDLPAVFDQILTKHRNALPDGLGTVEFFIRDPRPWHPKRFLISPTETRPSPEARVSVLRISATLEALVGIIVGSVNPKQAIVTGTVRIGPMSKTIAGYKVLRALRLRDRFYFTLGDVI